MVPTTSKEISKAQQQILAAADPLTIQKGEFVYFIKSQEVYTGQQSPSVSLMEEEALTVLDRVDGPGYLQITMQKEVIDHLTEGSPQSLFKEIFYIGTEPQEENENDDTNEDNTDSEDSQIKFYNLKVTDEVLAKPKKVQEKEPCANEKDCLLDVKKVAYDIVFQDPQNPQTTKVETWISTQVPYFASILQSCFTTVISVDTARPLVRQCKSVFDYEFK